MTESQIKLTEALLNALNHRTGAAVLGAGAGALTGALLPNGKNRRWRRAALGSLIGAGAGYGAARAFPGQSAAVNEALLTAPLRKAVGRVVTNTMVPLGYTNKVDELQTVLRYNPKKVWRAILEDQPMALASADVDSGDKKYVIDRDVPYRMMFGLKPRTWAEPHLLRPDGTVRLSDAREKELLEDVQQNPAGDTPDSTPNHFYHTTLGNVVLNPAGPQSSQYKDRWDFDLNAGEKVNSVPTLLRALVGKLVKPVTFTGTIPAGLARPNNDPSQ